MLDEMKGSAHRAQKSVPPAPSRKRSAHAPAAGPAFADEGQEGRGHPRRPEPPAVCAKSQAGRDQSDFPPGVGPALCRTCRRSTGLWEGWEDTAGKGNLEKAGECRPLQQLMNTPGALEKRQGQDDPSVLLPKARSPPPTRPPAPHERDEDACHARTRFPPQGLTGQLVGLGGDPGRPSAVQPVCPTPHSQGRDRECRTPGCARQRQLASSSSPQNHGPGGSGSSPGEAGASEQEPGRCPCSGPNQRRRPPRPGRRPLLGLGWRPGMSRRSVCGGDTQSPPGCPARAHGRWKCRGAPQSEEDA